MTDYQFNKKMRRAKAKRLEREQRAELRNVKHPPKPKMETSKKMSIYIHVMCTAVIVYSLVAMWHFQDLSHLGVLIAGVVGEDVNYMTYCLKAFFAKKNAEAIKLQRDLEFGECIAPEQTDPAE